MTWYKKDIGRWNEAAKVIEQLQERFLLQLSMRPRNEQQFMAVFGSKRYESEDSVFSVHTVFFTPEAEREAQAFGAMPCDQPEIEGLSLLVGGALSWTKYFPDKRFRS